MFRLWESRIPFWDNGRAFGAVTDKLDVFVVRGDGGVYTAAWAANVAKGKWRGWWRIQSWPPRSARECGRTRFPRNWTSLSSETGSIRQHGTRMSRTGSGGGGANRSVGAWCAILSGHETHEQAGEFKEP